MIVVESNIRPLISWRLRKLLLPAELKVRYSLLSLFKCENQTEIINFIFVNFAILPGNRVAINDNSIIFFLSHKKSIIMLNTGFTDKIVIKKVGNINC